MSVSTADLAVALRLSEDGSDLSSAQEAVLDRVRGVATRLAESYAPDAPDVVQDEAVVRLASYLYDAQPGASQRFTNPFADSGAQALLARYRVVRAHKLEEPDDDDTE